MPGHRFTRSLVLSTVVSAAVLLVPAAGPSQEASGPCESSECCDGREGAELYGEVLAVEDAGALPGATVEFRVASPPDEEDPWTLEVEVDSTGGYRLCGVPTPARVEARAEHSGATSRSVNFRLESPGRVELSFEIKGAPIGLDSLEATAAASREASGPGRVVGRIEDAESGRPVAEATVTLEPAGLQALTNRKGQFKIAKAPAGEGTLAIHHVAYGDQSVEVDVPSGLTVNLDIEVPPVAIEAEEIAVRVERSIRSRHLEDRGFYERAEGSADFGTFLTPAALERRNAARVSHVLQQLPGVGIGRVCRSGSSGRSCSEMPVMTAAAPRFRGQISFDPTEGFSDNRRLGACPATVYLDGTKVRLREMNIDELVPVSSLAAVEVYRGPAATAPAFIDSESRCGVVVLWTRRGPGSDSEGGR